MKQSLKKIYGTVVAVAIASGVTGAFAYSAASRSIGDKDNGVEVPNNGEVNFEQALSAKPATRGTMQYIDLTDAAEKACNAVVYIKVVTNSKTQTIEYNDPFEDFFGDFFGRGNGGSRRQQVQTPKRESAGSGVIISSDGYIVTNNHVVENADEITITLNDNREYTGKVIGTDKDTDLALVKIDGDNMPTLPIGDSDALKVGEWVLAVGNPFNLTSTVTAGIVSAKARHLGATRNGIESFIQTDAAINAGNSGGALVNAQGELVGINAMLYSQTGSFTGYGFAIPTTIMKKVVADIKEYGTVQRAMLGISGMDLHSYIESQKRENSKEDLDFGTNDGVYVAEVSEEGSAADVLKKGDVVTSVDGKNITKMSELQESLAKYRPGDKVTVGFIRDKKAKSATMTLKNSNGTTKVTKVTNMAILGADFKAVTDKQKESLNISYGLQVKTLRPGRLKEAGMSEDFIILKANNQNIRSEEDLEAAFKSAMNSAEQTLWIWGKEPSGKQRSYAVYLGDE
jgi:Do/DeqQ family serine protease